MSLRSWENSPSWFRPTKEESFDETEDCSWENQELELVSADEGDRFAGGTIHVLLEDGFLELVSADEGSSFKGRALLTGEGMEE